MLKTTSEISSIVSKLPATQDSVAKNTVNWRFSVKKKVKSVLPVNMQLQIAVSDFTAPIRKRMAKLLAVRNFEPNNTARDLLEGIYFEDANALALLHSRNQMHFARHYDNRGEGQLFQIKQNNKNLFILGRCVDATANGLGTTLKTKKLLVIDPSHSVLGWRDDIRCGPDYPLEDGRPAGCNHNGSGPCCSRWGWCGITEAHCNCKKCIDYRSAGY